MKNKFITSSLPLLCITFFFLPFVYLRIGTEISFQAVAAVKILSIVPSLRIGIGLVSIYCLGVVIWFKGNYRKMALKKGRKTNTDLDREMVAVGVIFIEPPAAMALLSTFCGGPVSDLYLASAFSIVGTGFWVWLHRKVVFIVPKTETARPVLLNSYTRLLGFLVIVACGFLILDMIMIFYRYHTTGTLITMYLLGIPLHLSLAFGCRAVSGLRRRQSPVALLATQLLNGFLILWIPVGTCLFVYWYWRIRRKEMLRIEKV